jgi:ABC-type multidrug transport system ATPase subunit
VRRARGTSVAGRNHVARAVEVRANADEQALALRGVRHRFGEHVALAGVDLTVGVGEVFGLLGPNGAGKTTTIRILNTLLPLQEGAVEVFGHDVRRSAMTVRRLLRRRGELPDRAEVVRT